MVHIIYSFIHLYLSNDKTI